jgi:hypothetical protein
VCDAKEFSCGKNGQFLYSIKTPATSCEKTSVKRQKPCTAEKSKSSKCYDLSTFKNYFQAWTACFLQTLSILPTFFSTFSTCSFSHSSSRYWTFPPLHPPAAVLFTTVCQSLIPPPLLQYLSSNFVHIFRLHKDICPLNQRFSDP